MATRTGRYTLLFQKPPAAIGFAAVGGKMEGEGPLGRCFDRIYEDTLLGQESWEKAESMMQSDVVGLALDKAAQSPADIDYILAGDLLNQCIGSTFGLRDLGIPLLGLFGACSTMALGLGLSALLVETGCASLVAAVTSSHFCSAERQFRYPLDYGGQRPPSAQWTATAAGAAILAPEAPEGPYVAGACFGRILDMGVKDQNNMGAAMAGAAAATIADFFHDTGTSAEQYDMIVTGDLGSVGSALMSDLLARDNISLGAKRADCGEMIYDAAKQDVHAGGSGCGCSAGVVCGHILPALRDGSLTNVLFVGTGALMSPTSVQQGESIPGIAHAVWLTSQSGAQQ